MDNWGDPWADNAKSPAKSAVTLPAFAPAPVPVPALLNGFLDDAGWGNDEESFGDWAAETGEDAQPAGVGSSAAASESLTNVEDTTLDAPWDVAEKKDALSPRHDDDWAAATSASSRLEEEKVPSEASDSSTTIHADDAADDVSPDYFAHTQPADDSSARASTSPSEGSRNDVPAESPRTSYEEERGAVRVSAETVSSETQIADETGKSEAVVPNDAGETDHVTPDRAGEMHLQDASVLTDGSNDQPVAASSRASSPPSPSLVSSSSTSAPAGAYVADTELLAELFPLQQDAEEPNEAPDDPIYSISARKAWYRLTRKQTLREFHHGHDDGNYIRVTWTNSGIKEEVNKVVGRWAREDRISGTGPGARASFYWDTPAPTQSKPPSMHVHHKPSISASSTIAPKRDAPPPLSMNSPAAFDWSSPVVDPWQQNSPGLRSVSSPIAPAQPTVTKVRAPETRAGSLDFAQSHAEPSIRGRIVAAADETPAVATLISPPISNTPTSFSDPWAGLDSLDTIAPGKVGKSSAPVDEEVDDDWGEMVSSPIISTKIETVAHAERSSASYTPVSTPFTAKVSPLRDQSPDATHASSIVRLRGVISPTSAVFKAKSFVPLSMEHGPIGPGLLKAVNRNASGASRKAEAVDVQPVIAQNVMESQSNNGNVRDDEVDDFSSWMSAVPEQEPIERQITHASTTAIPSLPSVPSRPSTPVTAIPTPIPIDTQTTESSKVVGPLAFLSDAPMPSTPVKATSQSTTDSWADADFSIFESSILAAPPQCTSPKQQPLDSFSVFESRPRTTSSISSARSFARSPPRNVAPPSPQPLTGATNSAQRRKAEEDGIIAEILGGLPDLGYMLR
jgi:hypothetical protein